MLACESDSSVPAPRLRSCPAARAAGLVALALALAAPAALAAQRTPPLRTVAADCGQLRKGLEALQASLGLPPAQRAAAEQAARTAPKDRTPAKAHDYVMGGAMLAGDYRLAAWAAARSAELDWQPDAVTNIGVNLFYLNRLDDAQRHLECTREFAPESPFPLEALALVAFKRTDFAVAIRLIEQARRLLPDDTNVLYTAGIIYIKAGQVAKGRSYLWQAAERRPGDKTFEGAARAADPKGENKPKRPDDLEGLIGFTFEALDELVRRGENLAAYATRLEKLKGIRPPPVITADALKRTVATAKESLRIQRQALQKVAPLGGPAMVASMHNQIVLDYASQYHRAYFDLFLPLLEQTDPQLQILATALGTRADRLAPNLPLYSTAPYLWQETRHGFYALNLKADEEYDGIYQPCARPPGADHLKCHAAARRVWCPKVMPRFDAMKPIVRANMQTAAGAFPTALRAEHLFIRGVVRDVTAVADGIFKHLKPTRERAELEAVKATRQLYIQGLQGFAQVRAVQSQVLYETLPDQMRALAHDIESYGGKIKERCEQPQPAPTVPGIDKEAAALLAALKESGSMSGGADFECEITTGIVDVSIKPPKAGSSIPQVSTSTSGGMPVTVTQSPGSDRRGVELGTGISEANGIAVSGGVKLWGESGGGRPADYGVEVGGKLGLGVSKGGVGAACYFFNGSARVNARALGESYVRAIRS